MPIQVLPPQLANQIAAGEVVERPASVVKELVENSLDAGATRIDIDIEKGGAKLIRIRDNGCGIKKDELALALARHATSKIATLDDLEAIISLGFRGEALASISSVSRLTLTSRTAEQNEAWQAYAEGRDMEVTLKPAAHPVGTTLEVLDLFYNTPARRKFLRTEKTEFGHIDEVIRRIALARFDVSINLQHNGKTIRQYRAIKENEPRERRLGSICGTQFLQHALAISWQHGDLKIDGWVVDPIGARALTDMQYCYVNGRMMRDRLLNHAIRQAYQTQLAEDQSPAYVLYLEVDPHQVDVNVHPAKHEVRFHQSRLVHDFIYQAVVTVLQQSGAPPLPLSDNPADETNWQPENRASAGENHFNRPADSNVSPNETKRAAADKTSSGHNNGNHSAPYTPGATRSPTLVARENELYRRLLQTDVTSGDNEAGSSSAPAKPLLFPEKSAPLPEMATTLKTSQFSSRPPSTSPIPASMLEKGAAHSFGRVLSVWQSCHAIVERGTVLALLSLPVAEHYLRQTQLLPSSEPLKPQPLLIPLALTLADKEKLGITNHKALLNHFGIDFSIERNRLQIHGVPLPLRQQNLQQLLPALLRYLGDDEAIDKQMLTHWLAEKLTSENTQWTQAHAIQLLADLERLCPELIANPPANMLQPINLQPALEALQGE
ncbi:DNA mismatch repair endonuclease MutL [Budviciaceae bacterium BWR-B9]|uniref:DNA mismatch repair protein MutL n=1 Tax=Limnobaculum allomyrinae TaxID=2791986 RepID=A0ABS1IQZ2_9GAMM|nr:MULTISPECIES: DNA mismatch repair endonuclease MutL [Limnobaculum]MBK5144180.1 DNA mismatch repair endonuclease MutL [Limnobaculum allomyrinae]MBV7692076.1 DNA mismatch repair endonuclease MutL [Limnobaculum sp. M2-1]